MDSLLTLRNNDYPLSNELDIFPSAFDNDLTVMVSDPLIDKEFIHQLMQVTISREQAMTLAETILRHYASPGFNVRVVTEITDRKLLEEQQLEPGFLLCLSTHLNQSDQQPE